MELLVDVQDGIATLTLNREAQRNTLSLGLLEALIDVFLVHRDDPGVKCFVLTAAGSKAFCAGGDVTAMAGRGHFQDHMGRRKYLELLEAMREAGHPIIGAVNGAALGGGFGLALACDLVVAGESATFGLPEVKLGLFPMMVAALLTRHLGPKRAMELSLLGERLTAQQAYGLGLVNRVVPDGELASASRALAERVGALSPATLRLGREAIYTAADMEWKQALRYLHALLTVNAGLSDAAEGVTAFLERRAPSFSGE